MANPLELGSVSPAPPNPNAGNALQQGAPQAAQQAAPSPSHAQTVAFLRHADAIKGELEDLLKNPALGRSNMKSQIIDSVTRLVSERMIPASQAVQQLAQVPDDPIAQRKWLTQMDQNVTMSERAVLAHHAVGYAGQGPEPTPDQDSHMDMMSQLGANYGGR